MTWRAPSFLLREAVVKTGHSQTMALGAAISCALAVAVVRAQTPGVPNAARDTLQVRAVLRVAHVSEAIRLDATLRDAAWSAADSIVDLRQREPLEGAPASERTVVKVLR